MDQTKQNIPDTLINEKTIWKNNNLLHTFCQNDPKISDHFLPQDQF
jgi:hypothetical protein